MAAGDERQREEPPQPLDRLVARVPQAMILAGPGSGKSEWLRRLARAAAREAREKLWSRQALPEGVTVPVFLPLARLADALHEDRTEALCRLAGRLRGGDRPDTLSPGERAAAAVLWAVRKTWEAAWSVRRSEDWSPRVDRILWEKLTGEGDAGSGAGYGAQALICLDAWDETSASEKKVLREGLRPLFAVPQLQLRMTSRPGSYAAADSHLFGRHQEFTIRPFTPDDTRRFIEGYFKDDPARAAALVDKLPRNPRLASFAENPLQATLLCLIYEEGGNLPPRRVDLYRLALDMLMTRWLEHNRPEEFRRERNRWLGHRRGRESMCRLLQTIAEEAFPATTIGGEALYDLLVGTDTRKGYLDDRSLFPEGDPVRPWVSVLGGAQAVGDALCDLGLMTRSGDTYAFLHTTFQEYLLASALARRANRNGFEAIAADIDRRAWDIAWREVIILLAGLLADPAPLIELLADPARDDIAHHRTILAALALPELSLPDRDRLAATIEHITNIVVDNAREELKVGASTDHYTPALPSLLEVNGRYGLGGGLPLRDWLARETVDNGPNERLFRACGTAAATPEIVTILLRKLDDLDGEVTRNAAWAMCEIVPAAAPDAIGEVVVALLRRLDDPDAYVRGTTTLALGWIAPAAPPDTIAEVVAALRRRLDDLNWQDRRRAALALGEIAPAAAPDTIAEVVTTLLARVEDADEDVRGAAAWALGCIAAPDAIGEVVVALLRRLDDPDANVRGTATLALGWIAPAAPPDTIAHLVTALLPRLDEADERVRMDTAFTLGRIAHAAPNAIAEVVTALLRQLDDPDENVRCNAARALVGIAPAAAAHTIAEVATALLPRLNDADEDVRRAAAETLGEFAPAAVPGVLNEIGMRIKQAVERHGSVNDPVVLAAYIGSLRIFRREPEWIAVPLDDLISGRWRAASAPLLPSE
jgi:HEAT repeat protein